MERTIKCRIKDYEMNYSYNPSLLKSGSEGELLNFALDPNFTPYATSLALYNDSNDLLAIVKFSEPLPISSNSDTFITIRIDV